jgi:hypothetical protein
MQPIATITKILIPTRGNFSLTLNPPFCVPFLELVNPFTEEEENVVQLCSKVVMEESISQSSDAKRRDSTTSFCLGQTMQ